MVYPMPRSAVLTCGQKNSRHRRTVIGVQGHWLYCNILASGNRHAAKAHESLIFK